MYRDCLVPYVPVVGTLSLRAASAPFTPVGGARAGSRDLLKTVKCGSPPLEAVR